MPFLWGFSPGRTALLLLLLFFRTCDPTDPDERGPRLFNPTDPLVSFGEANLVVIGEDTNGTVQTLLENVGLWDTFEWTVLIHYQKKKYTAKRSDKDSLEERVFKLRDFGTGGDVFNSSDCVCIILKDRPFPVHEGNNSKNYHTFLVVVSLVTEPCPGLKRIACHHDLKKKNGIRLIHTSVEGDLLDTTAFKWMKEKKENTADYSVAVEFPFLAKTPDSVDDWMKLADAREKLNDDLSRIANKGKDGRIPNATCQAPIPPQEDCEEVGKDECQNHTKIYEDDTDCTTAGSYCRECFVKRTTTTSTTTTTTTTTTTKSTTQSPTTIDDGTMTQSDTAIKTENEMDSSDGETDATKKGGLASWVIVLIVVILIFLLLSALAFFFVWRRRQNKETPLPLPIGKIAEPDQEPANETNEPTDPEQQPSEVTAATSVPIRTLMSESGQPLPNQTDGELPQKKTDGNEEKEPQMLDSLTDGRSNRVNESPMSAKTQSLASSKPRLSDTGKTGPPKKVSNESVTGATSPTGMKSEEQKSTATSGEGSTSADN